MCASELPTVALMVDVREWGLVPGPFEEHPWPEKLSGHVTTVGPEPRMHGYDVQGDLSRHYSFAEVALLSLTGSAPEADVGRAFETCLVFLAPVPVSEAPANAAMLAQMAAARPNCVLAVAAVALSEQAKFFVTEHAALLTWLDDPQGALPEAFRAQTDDDRSAVGRLRAALGEPMAALPAFAEDPTLSAAIVLVLNRCGIKLPQHIEAAMMLSRLCPVAAEAFAVRRGTYRDYPHTLPQYRYIGGDGNV